VDGVESRIMEAVDPDGLVRTLSELIAFESVGGAESPIQERMAELMAELGMDVDVWELDLEALARDPACSTEIERDRALGVVGGVGRFTIQLASVTVPKWFVRNRGLAHATVSAGFSIGPLVFPIILQSLIDTVGWREAWFFMGLALLALLAPASFLIIRAPADVGMAPDGDSAERSGPPEMTVPFLGLTGPAGVLPQHYTARLIRALRNRDLATRDFFDLFNHRLISLFYKAAEKHWFPLGFERTRHGHEKRRQTEDSVTAALYSLVGLGTGGTRHRTAIDDQSIVHYGGHFSRTTRSAVALELMLEDRFAVHARVLQFQGQRHNLDQP
jgi:hypothetical protein